MPEITVQRCCNGCGRSLRDVTESEIDAAVAGQPLPDVRQECPHCSEILRGSSFETVEAAVAWMRETCLGHLQRRGHRQAEMAATHAQPHTLMVYLRRYLAGEPGIAERLTAISVLLEMPAGRNVADG